ncbi:MAG: hypothetical protein ABEJ66_02440, partial [Candidatus Nanohaloarchaea archaeon]
MVDEGKLEQWVRQKLDSGVDPERLKESLKDTGHDPSIVDDVRDPFQQDEVEPADEEDFEQGAGRQEGTGDVSQDRGSGGSGGDLDSGIGVSDLSGDDKGDFETRDGGDRDFGSVESGEGGKDDGGGLSLPSLPSLSGYDLPLWPAVVIGLVLAGFAGYSYVPWSSLGLPSANLSAPAGGLPGGGTGSEVQECPD